MITLGALALAAAVTPRPCAALRPTEPRARIEARLETRVAGVAEALPRFCRVVGTLRPARGSRIGFELWLPEQWNGRFQMLGNGGYASSLPLAAMARALRQGYAVTATDTGHDGDDPVFAKGHPAAIVDWSWRAVHVTALAAKALVRQHYGTAARFAYFSGCSTGGHQAFSEAQRFPRDFDGIVAGAPGYDRIRLNAGFLWQFRANHPDGPAPVLARPQLDLLQRSSFAACHGANGGAAGGLSRDPWLNDPLQCRFDPAVALCKPGHTADCLSPAQVTAARAMYGGVRDEAGKRVFYPWLPGSEAAWSSYWADPKAPDQPARASFWRYWIGHGEAWDWRRFRFGADLTAALRRKGRTIDAAGADLSRFFARGGRLLHYHGLADPVVPPEDSIAYRDRVVAARGGHSDAAYRLFLLPGVGHCSGGAGPDQVDYQQAIEAWTERGVAPAALVARSGQDQLSRPICAYPNIAVYRGGPPAAAASFACAAPSITGRRS